MTEDELIEIHARRRCLRCKGTGHFLMGRCVDCKGYGHRITRDDGPALLAALDEARRDLKQRDEYWRVVCDEREADKVRCQIGLGAAEIRISELEADVVRVTLGRDAALARVAELEQALVDEHSGANT